MTDPLERVARKVSVRLEEIDEEAERLRRFLSALDGRPAPVGHRSAARRARHGERQRQFLAAAEAQPDSTVAELAKAMGVSTNQASGLATRLAAEGKISREGRKIRVAGKG